jgi:hypothetical protein
MRLFVRFFFSLYLGLVRDFIPLRVLPDSSFHQPFSSLSAQKWPSLTTPTAQSIRPYKCWIERAPSGSSKARSSCSFLLFSLKLFFFCHVSLLNSPDADRSRDELPSKGPLLWLLLPHQPNHRGLARGQDQPQCVRYDSRPLGP